MGDSDRTAQLLERWQNSDDEALGELLEDNLDFIVRYVRRRLGGKLRAKEETFDMVQEALVEFLRHGPRFKVENVEQLRAFLCRVCENRLRDKHDWYAAKRRDMNRERPLTSGTVINLAPHKSVTRPSVAAQRAETEARLRLALEFLDPLDRKIIVMREYDGLEFASIAERLDMKESAVTMRFHRALPKLANKLKSLSAGRIEDL